MDTKQTELVEKCRLTDEEIARAAYERNKLFGENDTFAYTRKSDADRCIADKATVKAIPIISAIAQEKDAECQQKLEEARKQERERIIKLLPEMATRFDHNRTCFDCVENIKRQARKSRTLPEVEHE